MHLRQLTHRLSRHSDDFERPTSRSLASTDLFGDRTNEKSFQFIFDQSNLERLQP